MVSGEVEKDGSMLKVKVLVEDVDNEGISKRRGQ